MEKSLVHVYTGDGKGKSCCAFGLAIRCAGNGYKVKIIQFLKTYDSGEVSFLEKSDNIQVYRFESKHGFIFSLNEQERQKLQGEIDTATRFAELILEGGECDLLVLDEIICAVDCGFVRMDKLCELIEKRGRTEVVLTGRNAPQWLINKADYVTVLEKIKHPYDNGIDARCGIEY